MSNQIFKSPNNANDNCNVLGDIWMESANLATDLCKNSKHTGEVYKFFEKDGIGFLLWAAQNLHCVSTENKQVHFDFFFFGNLIFCKIILCQFKILLSFFFVLENFE